MTSFRANATIIDINIGYYDIKMICKSAALMQFNVGSGLVLCGDSYGLPDDPPVLLLPGSSLTREMWRGAAEALAVAGRHAICLDPRGHGDSGWAGDGVYSFDAYAQDLRAVLAQLPARAVVVAQGMSGLAAIMALADHAHLAAALILVGISPWIDAEAANHVHAGLSLRARDFASRDDAVNTLLALYPHESKPFDPSALHAAFAERDDGRWRWRGDPRTVGAFDLDGLIKPLEQAAGALRVPVAVIRGADNRSVPSESVHRLGATIPDCEIVEIGGSGHHVAIDRLDAFNASVLDFLERKAPRRPIVCEAGSDTRLLRDALGCFATGVAVVTSLSSDDEPIGLTANSITSVSLDPPLLLFCLAKRSGNLDAFRSAGRFAINVLNIGQQPTSNKFARAESGRFDGIDWAIKREEGAPILSGALAAFDCRTFAMHDGGDHLIFIGEVVHAYFEPHRDPLLYFRGRYRRLHLA